MDSQEGGIGQGHVALLFLLFNLFLLLPSSVPSELLAFVHRSLQGAFQRSCYYKFSKANSHRMSAETAIEA